MNEMKAHKCQSLSLSCLLDQRSVGRPTNKLGHSASSFEEWPFDCRSVTEPFVHRRVSGHFGCVNALEFSVGQEELLASGGDDKRVLLWRSADLLVCEDVKPRTAMRTSHESNIFCLAFDSCAHRLWSAGNDHTVILHDVDTGKSLDVWRQEAAVYSLSVDPDNDWLFATATENGAVKLWDTRAPPSEGT